MKQGADMDGFEKQEILRRYLLGTLAEESVRAQIEERLIADDEYAASLSAAEDELIEEFLDGELTAEESRQFGNFYLAAPERKRQLRLTRDLRRLSAKRSHENPHRERSLTSHSWTLGWLRFAFVAGVFLIAAFSVWRFAIYSSDTEKGIERLQAAYRDQRPLESRMAEFGAYAPFSETRGAAPSVSDPASLESANRYLLDASVDPNNAAAHRALATYYASTRDFERAIRECEIALKAAPDDAHVQSDAGAVYYEAAKDATDNASRMLRFLDESLKHTERAIEIDPKFPEPRFNRALALEALTNTEQAKTAWHEYLDLDPNSRWSDEARRHVQKLEQEMPMDRSADQLESDFLAAFRSGDRVKAATLLSEAREAIRERYLPQRLAMSYTMAEPDRRDELLRALKFCGEIELERTGDGYAKDIAHFYSSVGDEKLTLLRDAQQAIRDGYKHCLANEYQICLSLFRTAHDGFAQTGDEPESRLADYFIGYGLVNSENHAGALSTINEVANFARGRNYHWLEMTAMNWVGGCLVALKKNTDAYEAYVRALSIARESNDSYAIDRNLINLAELESYSRQDSKALQYMLEALRLSSPRSTSARQRYRDLASSVNIYSRSGLFHAARLNALESIEFADLQRDDMWRAQSRGYAAVAFQKSGDLRQAKELLEQSRSIATSIANEKTREKVTAFAQLRSGDVEYASGDYGAALQFYSDAAELYDSSLEIPLNREEAHMGVLQSDLALGKTDDLASQIPINIRLAEESRFGIQDEEQRTGFFDSRVNIYDIASEFELSRSDPLSAYDYAEASSSRSLLDHMLSGLDQVDSATGQRLLLADSSKPLTLAEIRSRMSADSQILQFSVFKDKLVIWNISKDGFAYSTVPIAAAALKEKIRDYAVLVSSPNSDKKQEEGLARELYDLLIGPVRDRLDPKRELCIVPSRVLFEIPFAALLTPSGNRLIKDFSMVYAPSASVFVLASTIAQQKSRTGITESLMAFGDPSFDHGRHPDLPPLASAADEVTKISHAYDLSTVLTREAATKSAFLNTSDSADVVHFAGHYVAQPGSPMSSYLLFASQPGDRSGDELTDLELAGWRLRRTRLVVLAACDSGAETWYEGEGMIGAARSMLAAGVPLVVASQWAVDSAATSELMIRFHDFRRKQGQSTASALRSAQIALSEDPSQRYSSPYYWAGFGTFGGSASF